MVLLYELMIIIIHHDIFIDLLNVLLYILLLLILLVHL